MQILSDSSLIAVFAGTTEGRLLLTQLDKAGFKCLSLVATEYGEQLIDSSKNIEVMTGRKDKAAIEQLLEKRQPVIVIDATHPFAVAASENIKAACDNKHIRYIRLLREKSTSCDEDLIVEVSNTDEAVKYLEALEGKVFVTTGSKELYKYCRLDNYKERITARILSTKESVDIAAELGFSGTNLICMQGPFSEELNYEMLKAANARYMVTKESGVNGGFLEKIKAARRLGIVSIVIKRPNEDNGVYLEEIMDIINSFNIEGN